MQNKFISLKALKEYHPKLAPFFSQSWVYAAITCYYSQQGKFNELEFNNLESNLIIQDYSDHSVNNPVSQYYGLVFEGHLDYWFTNIPTGSVVISGHKHINQTSEYTSVGFDFWDMYLCNEFSSAALYYEINRSSVGCAQYDVTIPVGTMRKHRKEFLQILNDTKQDLSIVTDDRQQFLDTDLRFSTLGIEVYFNKFGVKQFQTHTGFTSFYDTDNFRSIDHLPHKKMHSISRVNMALETTAYNTNDPFITEKTYKILAQHRPFVILGDTNILKRLKDQGFLTFDKYCDESYDNIADPVLKSQKIVEALKQLVESCKKYPEEIDQICKHNQARFFDQQRHTNNLADFGKTVLNIIN